MTRPSGASVLDRLSLHPRPGKAHARLPLGVRAVDARLGGGLMRGALHEVRAPLARDIGAATGVVLGLLAGLEGRVLWVSDPGVVPDAGLLCPDGMAQYGVDPGRLTLVTPVDVQTALWAAEQGARCTDLVAVVLHLHGNPRRYDRVAARRLMLRAQESGVTVILLRQSGVEEASAAQTRWRVEPLPSPPDRAFPAGIGLPQFRLVLERTRDGRTGAWPIIWNPERKAFDHGETDREIPLDRPAASADRPAGPRPLGQVVDLRRQARGRAAAGAGGDGAEHPADRGP